MLLKRFVAAAGIVLLAAGCVKIDSDLGVSSVPASQRYTTHVVSFDIDEMYLRMTDSLSGYSQTRLVIGSVRDADFGLTTRSACVTLLPLHDSLDLGKNPVCKSFYFSCGADTISYVRENQSAILQSVKVSELLAPTNTVYDCNASVPHGSAKVSLGTPIINGVDSLSVSLLPSYGQKYLDVIAADTTIIHDYDRYIKALPGLYLETGEASSEGSGRINAFSFQLTYDSDLGYITGNYGCLDYHSTYDGVEVDSTIFFYMCPSDTYNLDSLIENGTVGSYPQYCLNLTGHERKYGNNVDLKDAESFRAEGGGGYKVVIPSSRLRELAIGAIKDTLGALGLNVADTSRTVILKASLSLPFEFPEDYRDDYKYPTRISPTCRIHTSDTTVSYLGLTDSSDDNEDQGDMHRGLYCRYTPDISYHMQQVLLMNPAKVNEDYDLWMLNMAAETSTESTEGDSDLSEYYQYLAYQSYYNSVYGGYGGYSSYGYGDSYTNYYTYMMLAQYASGSTYTTSDITLDLCRFYNPKFYGPKCADVHKRPTMTITFAVPQE